MPIIEWVLTIFFSICQTFVLAKTIIPYEQFGLDIIIKVTANIYILNFGDLNSGTNPPQACNQAVLCVLLFASIGSTNMDGFRSL